MSEPGPRPRTRDLDELSFALVMALLCAVSLILLIAPTAIVLITSFTDSYSLKFPPPGLSVRWYVALLDAWQIHDAAWNSIQVALTSTAISIVLGTAAALAIGRSSAAWARALDSIFLSPLVLPALAFGLAVLMFFSLVGIALSFWTLVIGHVVVIVPYVLRTTIAALAQLSPTLLESSAILGASRLYTFRRITLPAIRGGIFAGAFLAFMSSFDNVPVSLFVADARNEMLPIRLWQILENQLDVRAAAVSGVLVFATLLLMLLMERFGGLSRRMR